MISALILAGGNGTRVGESRPKQFVEILGKPILAYTVEIYQNNSEVDTIEIVCHADWIDYVKDMVKQYEFSKVKWIVEGGDTFQQSVINGVNNLNNKLSDEDIVMIHYGASPFTEQIIIEDAIRVCKEKGMSGRPPRRRRPARARQRKDKGAVRAICSTCLTSEKNGIL